MPQTGANAVIEPPELLPEPLTSGIPTAARDILTLASYLLVPITGAAWFFGDMSMSFAVLGGGLVALANFWLLSRIVVKTTSGELNGGLLFGRMLSKFALLVVSLGVVVWLFQLAPLGVLLGVGTIFPAILLGSLLEVFRDRLQNEEGTN